ncbi:MAG: hypothetical protein ACI4NI_07465 [Candidatus Ornithospirochaeta sp.]
MEKDNEYLLSAKISSLIIKYSIPCVVSLLVAALYNIVDQLFIANADYLGSYGNAANNVVFPLTMVALAIATMIGDGCCTYSTAWHWERERIMKRRRQLECLFLSFSSLL